MYRVSVCFVLLCGLLCRSAFGRKLPSYITPCKRNDPDLSGCFKRVVEQIKPNLVKGIPELRVNPIDPMVVPKISINNFTGPSLGVDAELTDMTFYGGKNFVLKEHKADFNTGIFEDVLYVPKLNMTTKYRVKGRLLFLNIDASGPAQAQFEDMIVHGKLKAKSYQKNGKEYYKFDIDEFHVDIGKAAMYLENVFPNNPDITESTNKIINENIDVLLQDIKPIIERTSKDLVLNVINRVYDLYSVDELYPKE